MAKLSLTTITSRYASVDALNANFEAIEEALENTLSRDGTAPNVLEADIDVNGNRILNLPTPSTSGEPINLGWAVANYPDFQTVAGLATEIEALGDIVTEIIEVYNKRSSIITVGNNIGAVINVGDNISNVVTTSAYINPIITVSNNVSSIQTVKNNINSVNTVAGAISNVNTVAGSIASVNTVSGISSDVTAVALINGDVTTVSGISADVTTVAADGTDIGTVATNIADVNTVAGISGNVTTVAGDTANIGTVAGNIVDVNTVANISADVSDVAGISTNVTTVAGIQSDVSAVAANNVNVSTVAANIVDVNTFADTYFIAATPPGSATTGDLWYDTTNSALKVFDGSWGTIQTPVVIDDLNDVDTVTRTPTDGVRLVWNATSNKWETSGLWHNSYTATATLRANETALADTSGGAYTLNLPASAQDGDFVIIEDSANTFDTYNLTIGRNGNTINGDASDLVCDVRNVQLTLRYEGGDWNVFAATGVFSLNTFTNPTITNYTESVVAIGTVGATHTIDLTSGTVQTATLTASTATTFTMPTATAGKSFMLFLTQNTGASATFTGVKWGNGSTYPATAVSSKVDILTFSCDGTSWYGNYVLNY